MPRAKKEKFTCPRCDKVIEVEGLAHLEEKDVYHQCQKAKNYGSFRRLRKKK